MMRNYNFKKFLFIAISLIVLLGCSKSQEEDNINDKNYIINDGGNIKFVFDEGLNDDPKFRLQKDTNGLYIFNLYSQNQSIQRLSVRLLDGNSIVFNKVSGYIHSINWRSNLYWWLLEGDTVANITKTYFNPFTGEIQYINLPPLINWKDVLIPTINPISYTDELTGRGSIVIAPINEMRWDTMKIYVEYIHSITRQEEGSNFFEIIGTKTIMDSVYIVLR